MPLADHIPALDDRRFEDLVDAARTRIARYAPEWTDTNPGDAGFALVELFAWLSEMMIYRLGRTPELNYLKFLQLIGIELTPARPAGTVLTFPVRPTFAGLSLSVPERTPVASAEDDADGPIVFETERLLTALRAPLTSVQAFDGYAYADTTAANADLATGFLPFGPLANAGSALLLGFGPGVALAPSVELSLAIWPTSDRPVPPPALGGGGAVPVAAPETVVWEYWAGTEWLPLTVLGDDTVAMTRGGIVRLRTPEAGRIVPAQIGSATDAPRSWLRARLDRAAYERAPELAGIRMNAVPASNVQTVRREVLGGIDGTPGQTLRLTNTPILDGTLQLTINEMGTPEPWHEVPDFFGSGPDDRHFTLNRSTGEVRMGDGTRGAVPLANLALPASSVVAEAYRFGGGARGNVAAGQVSTLLRTVTGIDAAAVTNPVAADGGTDEETLEAAADRARIMLSARDRAVTTEDFEALAKQAGPIARARALPLHHPGFPGLTVPGTVTVVIVPATAGPRPAPSAALVQTVCAHLDNRRLATTELYVTGPTYAAVSLEIAAVVSPEANSAAATLALEDTVTAYLHPLTGGADGRGWPFGAPIRYVDLYRRALVDGVTRLDVLALTVDGVEIAECRDAVIPDGALVALDSLSVTLRQDEEALT